MTLITNPDPTIFSSTNDFDAEVRAFFDTTLEIDLTGKSLSIGQDAIGRIMSIDVDPSVTITGPQVTLVQEEFFNTMSIDTIIGLLTPPVITAYLSGFDSINPLTVNILATDTPTDITSLNSWVADVSKDFIISDDDIGEVEYTGDIVRTIPISYSLSTTTTGGSNRDVFGDIMLKPSAGSYAEIPGSRVFTDDDSNSNVKNITHRIMITLNPGDKFKINIGEVNTTQNMIVTNAGITIG